MGRPTKYTKAMAAKLCARLANGESLRSICEDKEFPCKSTILLWVVDGEHRDFSDQYMRAREAAGYSHADEIVDTVTLLRNEGIKPDVARVMMDGLKWSAERMAPKTHSPKQSIDHSSSDGSMTPAGLGYMYGGEDEDESPDA